MNENNLIPFSERSVSEAREAGAKGGKKSGESRRRKKSIRQKMQMLLALPAADNDAEQLAALGIEPDEMDNEMVLVMALYLAAAAGDVKAFDRIMDILGKSVQREELQLRKKELELKRKQIENGAPGEQELPALLAALTAPDSEDDGNGVP